MVNRTFRVGTTVPSGTALMRTGKRSTKLLVQTCPAGFVEQRLAEVNLAECSSIADVGERKTGTFEICLQVILQAKEDRLGRQSSPGFEVRVNTIGMRRVLLPVGDLVTVGAQNEVHRSMTLCALADTDKRRYTYSFLMTALARHDRLAACFTGYVAND